MTRLINLDTDGSPAAGDWMLVADATTGSFKKVAFENVGGGSGAPLDSPAFIGTPTAPTASTSTDNTQLATTAFVQAVVTALIDAAPGALDTLNEIAASLGDDSDFAGTMTALLAAKAPLASPALTGSPTAPTPSADDNSTKIATTAYVDNAAGGGGGPTVVKNTVTLSTAMSTAHGEGSVPDFGWLEVLGTDGKYYPITRISEEDENNHGVAVSYDATNIYCDCLFTADVREYGSGNKPSNVSSVKLCGIWF